MKRIRAAVITVLIMNVSSPFAGADQKMDTAVADMQRELQSGGFPSDMFTQNQEQVDAIQVNTTWWAFEPEIAKAFQRQFPNQPQPKGFFWRTDTFLSTNVDFEEAVMRTVWGESHTHLELKSVAEVMQGVPSEIKREFQTGTRVAFQTIARHIQSTLKAEGLASSISVEVSNRQRLCEVTTEYRQPPQGLHDWYLKNMEWAIRIRVAETTGLNETVAAGRSFSSSKSRVVLQSYLVVRAIHQNRAIEIGPIFENSFRKNGSDSFDLLSEVMMLVARPVDGHQHSGGIKMSGVFANRSPLLLMTRDTVVPDYLAPYQLKIANSLLADPGLSFESASQSVAKPTSPSETKNP